MTTKTEETAINILREIVDTQSFTNANYELARATLSTMDYERAVACAGAPVATEYMLLCQPNSAIRHQLEIKLYGHSLKGARATAIAIGSTLYPAGYTRFGIFDGNTQVDEFTLHQPDIMVR